MKFKIKLYHFYIFLITLCKAIGLSSESWFYVAVFVLGCFAVFMKMLQEKYTRNELLSMIFIVAVGLVDFVFGDTTTILFTAVAICGMKNIDSKQIIKIVFWTRLIGFCAMMILSTFGTGEASTIVHYRDGEFIERYTLGYEHPNTAHMAYTILVLLGLYLYGNKVKPSRYIALILGNYIVYAFTFSRTGLWMCNLSILLWVALHIHKLRPLILKYGRLAYLLLFILTLCFGLLYGRVGFLDSINDKLTGRIAYVSEILKNHMPPIFGSNRYEEDVLIDNGYIAMIYQGGILAFAWISYYLLRMVEKIYLEQRYRDFFLVTCFIIYNFTESFFPSISVNISLLLLGEVIFVQHCGRTDNRIGEAVS